MQTTIDIPESDLQQLDKLGEQDHLTREELMRAAVTSYLRNKPAYAPQPQDTPAYLPPLTPEDRKRIDPTGIHPIPTQPWTPERKEQMRKALEAAFGIWADRNEDGMAYQERMRAEWPD